MTIKRWAAKADSTAAEVRDGLRAAGWFVLDLRQPWDFFVAKGDRREFVEAKSPGGTLTAAQTRLLCECPAMRPIFARSSREALLQLEPRSAPVEATSAADIECGDT